MNPENLPLPYGTLFPPFEKSLLMYNLMNMQKLPIFNYAGLFPHFGVTGANSGKEVSKPFQDALKKEDVDQTKKELEEVHGEKNRDFIQEIEEKTEGFDKNEGIQMILKYFIQNIGRVRSNRINSEREKFSKNPELLQIFDLLMKKYIMSNKTKEEKIKYILRKSFKYLGSKLKRENIHAKNIKSKKEFDHIFNDFYMGSGLKLTDNEEKEGKLKFKLVFT